MFALLIATMLATSPNVEDSQAKKLSPPHVIVRGDSESIKLGMTEEQVRNILGPTIWVGLMECHGRRENWIRFTMQWELPDGKVIYVAFDSDRATRRVEKIGRIFWQPSR
jgi:hypothetical protein